jgi:hypothetical protein
MTPYHVMILLTHIGALASIAAFVLFRAFFDVFRAAAGCGQPGVWLAAKRATHVV